ncbi:MAG: hypothetical protein LUF33_06225 [Clostridiales bacterium]|nr:hypothetical protein [Clostridiales bacterium]
MADNKNMKNLLGELSRRLGVDESQLESAAKQGNLNDVLKNTDEKQAQALESVLGDPEKTKRILSSPQAQALLKLLGGDENG